MQQPLLALPVSIIFIVISMAFGRKMLSWLRVKTSSPIENSVFGLGLGLGILSYLILAAGLLEFLYLDVLLAIVGVMGVFALSEIRSMIRETANSLRENSGAKLTAADSLITLAAVSLGALALICALAPPMAMEWDALAYHLAVPKLYLSHHSIYYILFTSHSNFPFLTEMLYTLGLSTGSVGVAKLFHFCIYIGTALALYSMGKRHLSATAGKISALLYMSIPVVFYEAGIAYVDLTMGFYVILAMYAMLNWQETKADRWLVVCSIMGGFALGTKVLTGIPIFMICLLIALSKWIMPSRPITITRALQLSILVGLGAIAVGAVWYIKAYIYTGNPVYPFLYNIFGGRNWSVECARAYQAEQGSFGMGKSLSQLFVLPWNLLANGYKFTNKQSADVFALVGPAFIGLLPVYVLKGKLNKVVVQVLAVGVVWVVAWFFLMQHSRYLIAGLPLLCVVAGVGAEAGLIGSKACKGVVTGFIALTVLLSLYAGVEVAALTFRAATGMQSADEYLTKYLDVYEIETWANRNLPADSKIVLFDEVRGFYLDRNYIWGNPNNHELIPWREFRTGGQMVRWFKEHGYTHMLINRMYSGGQDNIRGKLFPEAIGLGMMRELKSTKTCKIYGFVIPPK